MSTEPAPVPRWHLAVLALLVLVGVVRGLFWVSTIQVLGPIDEAQHLDYVVELWEEAEPPVVGEDLIDPAIAELVKSSPTTFAMSFPSDEVPDDDWGVLARSYEGIQPPLGYAVLLPAYALARPFGMLPALYAVRIATLLVAIAAVPLAYALSREVLPARPYAWLGAPLLLVFVQGMQANNAVVTNDALVVPLGAALLLPVARAVRRGPTTGQAVALGVLGGAALLTKATTVLLAPVLLVGVVIAAIRWRPRWRQGAWWVAVATALAGSISAPWWWWNLSTYGALTAGDRTAAVTGTVQPRIARTLSGLVVHLESAMTGFWELFPFSERTPYGDVWFIVVGTLVLAGTVHAAWRRRWAPAAMLPWLGSAPVLAFLTMLVLIVTVSGGAGTVTGRYLYPTLVAVLVAGACGLGLLVPGRWFAALALGIVALVSWFEPPIARHYVHAVYTGGLIDGDLAPVVDQRWSDGWVDPEAVVVAPPCPAQVVDLRFDAAPPGRLDLAAGGAARLEQQRPTGHGILARYRLPVPTEEEFTLALPGPEPIGYSERNRTTRLAMVGADGDPLASVYCEVDDPRAFRFRQLHGPQHPDLFSYGETLAWLHGWKWITTGAAAIALLAGAVREILIRRSAAGDDGRPSAQDVA